MLARSQSRQQQKTRDDSMAKDSLDSKICSKCQTPKLLSEFGNNRTTKDGKQYYCRTCARNAVKAYLTTEQGKANNLKWQAAHRNRVRV
jgi:superfamily II helicase